MLQNNASRRCVGCNSHPPTALGFPDVHSSSPSRGLNNYDDFKFLNRVQKCTPSFVRKLNRLECPMLPPSRLRTTLQSVSPSASACPRSVFREIFVGNLVENGRKPTKFATKFATKFWKNRFLGKVPARDLLKSFAEVTAQEAAPQPCLAISRDPLARFPTVRVFSNKLPHRT